MQHHSYLFPSVEILPSTSSRLSAVTSVSPSTPAVAAKNRSARSRCASGNSWAAATISYVSGASRNCAAALRLTRQALSPAPHPWGSLNFLFVTQEVEIQTDPPLPQPPCVSLSLSPRRVGFRSSQISVPRSSISAFKVQSYTCPSVARRTCPFFPLLLHTPVIFVCYRRSRF